MFNRLSSLFSKERALNCLNLIRIIQTHLRLTQYRLLTSKQQHRGTNLKYHLRRVSNINTEGLNFLKIYQTLPSGSEVVQNVYVVILQ